MKFGVVTLFPEMLAELGRYGVVGRALDVGIASLQTENPREHTADVHRTVDDRPYGGGPGMVMKVEPLAAAIAALKARMPAGCRVVSLSPAGRTFTQAVASEYAEAAGLVLLAGRYEGIDERLIERHVDEELSLGDFVLSGGEIAAMAVVDAVTRLLPGALGDDESAKQDSFVNGLLDHPHYTRPEVVDGEPVPPVLLSGDHEAIARWRYKQALGRSFVRRPDLVKKLKLDHAQQELLREYLQELGTEK